MEIPFSGQYDRQTMHRAFMIVNRPTGRSLFLRLGMLALFGGAVIVALVDFLQGGGAGASRIIRYLLAFALLGYFLLRPYLTARRVAAQFGEKQENQARFQGIIDRRGVVFHPGPSEKLFGWEKFASWRVSADLAVLVRDDGNIFPFPRGFFESEVEWKRFQSLLKDRIKVAR